MGQKNTPLQIGTAERIPLIMQGELKCELTKCAAHYYATKIAATQN